VRTKLLGTPLLLFSRSWPLFNHPDIEKYRFEEVLLDRDLYLMDEKWMSEYDAMLTPFLKGEREYEVIGYISYAAARNISSYAIELSWYANIHTRFHELHVSLPRDQFVCCVGSRTCDEKPRIFVRSAWLNNLHLRTYSVFSLVDAVGIKRALERGEVTRDRLVALREAIDRVAEKYRSISFISFADSLLLKSNWSVGQFDSEIRYTYEPEILIRVVDELREVYRNILGLDLYAVLTQGSNEYYDDPLLHISATGNHISLNSLGLPFAQLLAIDHAARDAVRCDFHSPAELYIDENFFRSLSFQYRFERDECPMGTYRGPMMSADANYYMSNCREILSNLREIEDK
jgi:hypothetical protein